MSLNHSILLLQVAGGGCSAQAIDPAVGGRLPIRAGSVVGVLQVKRAPQAHHTQDGDEQQECR